MYTPRKRHKTRGFLTFSGGIQMTIDLKWVKVIVIVTSLKYPSVFGYVLSMFVSKYVFKVNKEHTGEIFIVESFSCQYSPQGIIHLGRK